MSKAASLNGVTHTHLCLSTVPDLLRGDSPINNRVTQKLHTERGAYMTEVSNESFRSEVLVTDGAHIWRGC